MIMRYFHFFTILAFIVLWGTALTTGPAAGANANCTDAALACVKGVCGGSYCSGRTDAGVQLLAEQTKTVVKSCATLLTAPCQATALQLIIATRAGLKAEDGGAKQVNANIAAENQKLLADKKAAKAQEDAAAAASRRKNRYAAIKTSKLNYIAAMTKDEAAGETAEKGVAGTVKRSETPPQPVSSNPAVEPASIGSTERDDIPVDEALKGREQAGEERVTTQREGDQVIVQQPGGDDRRNPVAPTPAAGYIIALDGKDHKVAENDFSKVKACILLFQAQTASAMNTSNPKESVVLSGSPQDISCKDSKLHDDDDHKISAVLYVASLPPARNELPSALQSINQQAIYAGVQCLKEAGNTEFTIGWCGDIAEYIQHSFSGFEGIAGDGIRAFANASGEITIFAFKKDVSPAEKAHYTEVKLDSGQFRDTQNCTRADTRAKQPICPKVFSTMGNIPINYAGPVYYYDLTSQLNSLSREKCNAVVAQVKRYISAANKVNHPASSGSKYLKYCMDNGRCVAYGDQMGSGIKYAYQPMAEAQVDALIAKAQALSCPS